MICNVVRRERSAIDSDRDVVAYIFSLVLLSDVRTGENMSACRQTSDDELLKMPQAKARKFKPRHHS